MSITDVPSATAARAVSFLLALFFVVGCSASGPAATNLDTRLLGEWETDSGARYSIAADGKEYVIGIVDYDDEVFEVESVLWEDGTLA
ncbi:MAG: hypothetical protein R3284_08925, partial [Rubricoccaceae bacterium]|nr:hypothetical protein [Rubricoccaceae bacterium]